MWLLMWTFRLPTFENHSNKSHTGRAALWCGFWRADLSYCSGVASPLRHVGQNERFFSRFCLSFPIFPLFPDFPRFFPLLSDFSLFFPILGKIFAVRGGTLPPLPPTELLHCELLHCEKNIYLTKYTLIGSLFGVSFDVLIQATAMW